jgi:hypothetical protein
MSPKERERNESEDKGPMEYVIGDKTYVQKPLVLGQIKQLTKVLKGIQWPKILDISEIINAVIDVVPEALSIVLIEKGKESIQDLKTRDLKLTQEDFEYAVDTVTLMRVVDHFLSCNPINSLWRMMRNVISTTYTAPALTEETQVEATGLIDTSSTLPEETSQEETQSSGGTP